MFHRILCVFAATLALGGVALHQDAFAEAPARPGVGAKVIGGSPISDTDSPVVKLRLNDGESICTGSLISPRVVLTAAHCVKQRANSPKPIPMKPSKVVVIFNGRFRDVARIQVHPKAGKPRPGYQDLALVFLKKKLPAQPLPLLLSRDVHRGDAVKILGYGFSNDGYDEVLHEGTAHIDGLTDDLISITIKDNEATACHGDSGGPLIMSYVDDGGVSHSGIVGTTIGGSGKYCNVGDTGYYTRLRYPALLNFIRKYVPDVQTR